MRPSTLQKRKRFYKEQQGEKYVLSNESILQNCRSQTIIYKIFMFLIADTLPRKMTYSKHVMICNKMGILSEPGIFLLQEQRKLKRLLTTKGQPLSDQWIQMTFKRTLIASSNHLVVLKVCLLGWLCVHNHFLSIFAPVKIAV